MTITTTAGRLKAAAELGRRIRAIRAEPGLWSLSRDAWRRQCLELSGWSEPADLLAADRRVAQLPHLDREVSIRARLWCDGRQDHPAPYHGFGDGDRFGPAYSELLAASLTVEQVSAVAALRCAQLRDGRGEPWGRADSLADGPRALAPHKAALAELDRLLRGTALISQLGWRDGWPVIEHGGIVVEVSAETAKALGSAFAAAAELRVTREPESVVA